MGTSHRRQHRSHRFPTSGVTVRAGRWRVQVIAVMAVWLSVAAGSPAMALAQESIQSTLGAADDRGADVRGAFTDSLKLLLIEHGTRVVFQGKTRRELGGNFWGDYGRSVRIPNQWTDTDAWWVNYIGHPIHGAAAGYLWLDHEQHAPPDFERSGAYWSSRARAMAWAAGYSLQFELGLMSEASLGNVGMRPETAGWVDHVVTPAGAFGLIVAEDVLDRYVVTKLEARVRNTVVRAALRLSLNPGRALSNSAAGRLPWIRDGRPLNWR